MITKTWQQQILVCVLLWEDFPSVRGKVCSCRARRVPGEQAWCWGAPPCLLFQARLCGKGSVGPMFSSVWHHGNFSVTVTGGL